MAKIGIQLSDECFNFPAQRAYLSFNQELIMAIFYSEKTWVIGVLCCCAVALVSPVGMAADRVAQVYPVKDFTEVSVGGNTLLEVTQDGTEYLRVEASPEVMQRVKVDLSGKRLTLGVKHKGGFFNWFDHGDEQVRFILRVKHLTFVELSGAARGRFSDFQEDHFVIHASGAAGAEFAALNAQYFAVQLSGASNLSIGSVNSKQQDFDLSGASNLEIKQASNVGEFKADLSGASNMRARALKAGEADVGASGASHIEISVSGTLDAEASGASSIDYYGNPKAQTDSSGASHINARGN
jgi:hypothetical protein